MAPAKYFKGCILLFEYTYFLLQDPKYTVNDVIDIALKKYQQSGTQSTVLSALQDALTKRHGDYKCHTLHNDIIDIILHNQMCKSSISLVVEVSNDVHQQRDTCKCVFTSCRQQGILC